MSRILDFFERISGHIIVGVLVAAMIIDLCWLGVMVVNVIW